MFSVAEVIRNGTYKAEEQQEEHCSEAPHHRKTGGEDRVGLFFLVVGIAEERRLHAKRQDDEYQGGVGIHVRAHAIIAGSLRHVVRVERHEQVVEEAAHDAREAVYRCVFEEGFEVCHSRTFVLSDAKLHILIEKVHKK